MNKPANHIEQIDLEKQLIPALRFKEFGGEHNEERLDQVFSIFNGYAFSSNDTREEGCRWVKIADVGINEMKEGAVSFLPMNYKKKYEKFILKKGDFVVALTRPILNGMLKIAIINSLFDYSLLNQRVGKLISDNDLEYVYYLLQKASIISRIENRIAGTDPPNLSPYEIASLKAFIPSLPEQQKIAAFLSAVDTKIRQLSRKKELLEQYKKGVMQRLFSQNHGFKGLNDGTDLPISKSEESLNLCHLRFRQEDGDDYPDWEEKLYGDIFSFYSTNSLSRDKLNYNLGEVKNIHYGDIHTKFSMQFDIDKEVVPFVNRDEKFTKIKEESYCKEGDLVIADASEDYSDIGKCIEIVNLGNQIVIAGLHTFLARPDKIEMYIGFSGYLVQAWYVRKQIMTIAQGTKVLSLSTGRLSKVRVNIPCYEEQEKIADYLTGLDTKIENVAVQVEATRIFKKGLLQQMFV